MAGSQKVFLRIFAIVGDGDDSDAMPDRVPVSGSGRLIPTLATGSGDIAPGPDSIHEVRLIEPIPFLIIDGMLTYDGKPYIWLPVPTGQWQWRIAFDTVRVGDQFRSLREYAFPLTAATPAQIVDPGYPGVNIAQYATGAWEPGTVNLTADAIQQINIMLGRASNSALDAGGHANRAEGARDDAQAAQGLAEGARDDAQAAQGLAEGARDDAQVAQGLAEGARDDAQAAQGLAETARTGAEAARTGAETARTGAEEARDAADGHADRAEAAVSEFGLTATATTGAPGTEATVTLSGDGPAYGLSFTVPRGEKGVKGDRGDDGTVSQAMLDAAVASLVDGAPEALDTLTELAAALGNDPNFATTVSTEIGKRALIDGAPAAYNTLGKLVTALQNHELGGSTDASALEGALTDQVDASAASVLIDYGNQGGPETVPLSGAIEMAQYMANVAHHAASLNAPAVHTHPVTDLTATGTRSASTYLRGDGTWATPTNTTYSVPTQAEAEAGTATTGRAFSAQRVRQAANAAITAREWQGTQAQYDALPTKSPTTTYWIV